MAIGADNSYHNSCGLWSLSGGQWLRVRKQLAVQIASFKNKNFLKEWRKGSFSLSDTALSGKGLLCPQINMAHGNWWKIPAVRSWKNCRGKEIDSSLFVAFSKKAHCVGHFKFVFIQFFSDCTRGHYINLQLHLACGQKTFRCLAKHD